MVFHNAYGSHNVFSLCFIYFHMLPTVSEQASLYEKEYRHVKQIYEMCSGESTMPEYHQDDSQSP